MNNMKKITGSKFSDTWEEKIRKSSNEKETRFSNKIYIKNLKLLSEWCQKKINELSNKE